MGDRQLQNAEPVKKRADLLERVMVP